MKILIVSGFLGAGKTTFIKELIRRSNVFPVILENEYGENNIDAVELRRDTSSEMKILEFMEGCVCCTMKDSFVNSVLAVSASLDPEYLIVEPTGVGRLSSILANLKPIFYDKISLLKPVTVLSPEHCRQNMGQWSEFYADQVRNAGTIVFSKCEHTPADILEDAVKCIREYNPSAEIIAQHYTTMPDSWWRSVMDVTDETVQSIVDFDEATPVSRTPVKQFTINECKLESPAQLILFLEDCLRGEMGQIARAKGTLPVGKEMIRFDLADGLYALTGFSDSETQCVFIGKNLQKKRICERIGASPDDGSSDVARSLRKSRVTQAERLNAVSKRSRRKHDQ